MLNDRRNISLSKVIFLKDAFSEEAVANGIQIRGPQGAKPVLKPGGYVLFLNLEQEEFEVEIASPIYRKRKVRLRADRGKEAEEILLYPSEAYPVRAGCTGILGQAPPDSVLWFSLEETERECRLLSDYKREDGSIRIFQNGLLTPLKSDYRKKDAALYPAFLYRTDESGSLYLLLKSLKKQEYDLYYAMFSGDTAGKNRVCGTVKIRGQEQNILRFWQCKEG